MRLRNVPAGVAIASVLALAPLSALAQQPLKTAVDGTFGAGGYARAMLWTLEESDRTRRFYEAVFGLMESLVTEYGATDRVYCYRVRQDDFEAFRAGRLGALDGDRVDGAPEAVVVAVAADLVLELRRQHVPSRPGVVGQDAVVALDERRPAAGVGHGRRSPGPRRVRRRPLGRRSFRRRAFRRRLACAPCPAGRWLRLVEVRSTGRPRPPGWSAAIL